MADKEKKEMKTEGVPFVSVIVPVYNEERYIDECVRSMLAQDYPKDRMEWFFADGMSQDRTVEILEGYRAEHPGLINIIENPDRTVPYAMNLGIRASHGEYIIRLDVRAGLFFRLRAGAGAHRSRKRGRRDRDARTH